MKRRHRRSKPEPTIALINIVFLMLIFFLIAGTLAQSIDNTLKLVRTSNLDTVTPPDGLVIHADGRMQAGGLDVIDLDTFFAMQDDPNVRLIPDRTLPAKTLLQISADLYAAGAETILIATEREVQ